MKHTIKVTTLLYTLVIAGLGVWGGISYTKLVYGIKDTPRIEQNMDSAEIPSDEYKRIANNINGGN